MIDARYADPLEHLACIAKANGVPPEPETPEERRQALDGAKFILETPEQVPALWGNEEDVLWAQGEPLFLVGPAGIGKTTLGGQLTLARVGLRDDLLGLPVAVDPGRVLYIAADRPRQAARSFRRMVKEEDRRALEEALVVWQGPLPFDMAADPERFADFVTGFGVGTVVIDALKDIALELSRDEVGSRVNNALQRVIAAGVEVVVLHHQRKATSDNSKPRTLADVFGSTWITAGAGSVVLLWGDAGDPIVELRHLKQPAGEVGPLKLGIDHERGEVEVHEAADLWDLVRRTIDGLTVAEAARDLFGTAEPSSNEKEKARRRLDRLFADKKVGRIEGSRSAPTRYVPLELRREA
jgi:replicative DNA helicase